MGGPGGAAAAGVFSQHGGRAACDADLNMRCTWRGRPGDRADHISNVTGDVSLRYYRPINDEIHPARVDGNSLPPRRRRKLFFTPRLSPAVDT